VRERAKRGHPTRCGRQCTNSDTARCHSYDRVGESVACTARLAACRRRVRVLTGGNARRGRGPGGPPPRNPFLPYDEALWVAHLSARHTLLLNKFNVVRHHLLVVTRAFEPQAAPLSAGDLGATWRVMQARHPRAAPCRACVVGARPCPAAQRAALQARGWGCEFVVGGAGGSPVDAAIMPVAGGPATRGAYHAGTPLVLPVSAATPHASTPERRLAAGRLSSHSKAGWAGSGTCRSLHLHVLGL